MLDYCSRQIGHNELSSVAVWNAMCNKHLLPFKALDPERGSVVTNADFAAVPLRKAFDWKYGEDTSSRIGPMDTGQGLSIDIDGSAA